MKKKSETQWDVFCREARTVAERVVAETFPPGCRLAQPTLGPCAGPPWQPASGAGFFAVTDDRTPGATRCGVVRMTWEDYRVTGASGHGVL
ncbi:MAG: hypothetical protein FJ276_35000 [Planctomycetes bacterium]|nr:hypothetical protein [Planctomycetota bacterium]